MQFHLYEFRYILHLRHSNSSFEFYLNSVLIDRWLAINCRLRHGSFTSITLSSIAVSKFLILILWVIMVTLIADSESLSQSAIAAAGQLQAVVHREKAVWQSEAEPKHPHTRIQNTQWELIFIHMHNIHISTTFINKLSKLKREEWRYEAECAPELFSFLIMRSRRSAPRAWLEFPVQVCQRHRRRVAKQTYYELILMTTQMQLTSIYEYSRIVTATWSRNWSRSARTGEHITRSVIATSPRQKD